MVDEDPHHRQIVLIWRKNNAPGYVFRFRRQAFRADASICPVAVWRRFLTLRAAALRGGRATAPAPPGDVPVPDYAFVQCVGRTPTRLIARDTVSRWLKTAAASLGLDPAHFSGHSPRIAGGKAMFAAGVPFVVVMQQGYWTSVRGALPYRRRDVEDEAHLTSYLLSVAPPTRRAAPADQDRDVLVAIAEERERRLAGTQTADEEDSSTDDE